MASIVIRKTVEKMLRNFIAISLLIVIDRGEAKRCPQSFDALTGAAHRLFRGLGNISIPMEWGHLDRYPMTPECAGASCLQR
ncbi:MAG TPA: hypothetical protein VL598_15195 [Trinickia sp.]|jgi:hypothetical protein|uniref:hypothetical protein n=1 Tax=Trinickia sp. TaxID=2571163 RepID=UPI002C43CABE|nr:hypothetical protein [Trinickia sp.]HTI19004.1 hypothetical protein [Trinickia sp.]